MPNFFSRIFIVGLYGALLGLAVCNTKSEKMAEVLDSNELQIQTDADGNSLSVLMTGNPEPIVVQNAKPDFRPFVHPIVAPDGKGELTEYSPG
ncbi:MAG: hypothetical protein HKN31_13790, partial [Pricia sp.]|nr:hypothetical protein [Pricia sp.]